MCRSKGDPRGPYANGTFRCTLATRQALKKQYEAASGKLEVYEANGNKRGVASMTNKMAEIEAKEEKLPTQSTKGIIGNHSIEVEDEEPIDLAFESAASKMGKKNSNYSHEDVKATEALAAQIERVTLTALQRKSDRALRTLKRDAMAVIHIMERSEIRERMRDDNKAVEAERNRIFAAQTKSLSGEDLRIARNEYKEAQRLRVKRAEHFVETTHPWSYAPLAAFMRLDAVLRTFEALIAFIQAKRELNKFKESIGANA
jgi:hypothetical protein